MQEHYSGSFFTFSSCQGIYKIIGLKGQSNEILDPYLFSSFEPAWVADQQVKIFSILVSFSPRYSYFSESPRVSIFFLTLTSNNSAKTESYSKTF